MNDWQKKIANGMKLIKEGCAEVELWADCNECPFDVICDMCSKDGYSDIPAEWEIEAEEADVTDQYIEKRIEALEKEVESLRRMIQFQIEINDSQQEINKHVHKTVDALLKQKEEPES